MPLTDGKQYCPDCGREMKPLSQSFYCPNDCDRKPKEIEAKDEITTPIRLRCPKCNGPDVVRHNLLFWYGWKCVDCKHTWS